MNYIIAEIQRYRGRSLNAAVNGSGTSSHIKGQAADIIIIGMPAADVALTIVCRGPKSK